MKSLVHFKFLQGNHAQKISPQIQLDQDILDLLQEIVLALDFVADADKLISLCQNSDDLKKTLILLLEQISECGYFIQSYVKDVNFGKCYFLSTHTMGQGANSSTVQENVC